MHVGEKPTVMTGGRSGGLALGLLTLGRWTTCCASCCRPRRSRRSTSSVAVEADSPPPSRRASTSPSLPPAAATTSGSSCGALPSMSGRATWATPESPRAVPRPRSPRSHGPSARAGIGARACDRPASLAESSPPRPPPRPACRLRPASTSAAPGCRAGCRDPVSLLAGASFHPRGR